MPETPLYFVRSQVRLFGVLHEPEKSTGLPPFVFCHPLGEEKLWAHRVFVAMARELAGRGHMVLRFDCAGNGDSDLDFEESSLETNLADIETAVEFVRARTRAPQVSLLGLRIGASLAWRVAARREDVESLILWAPVLDGRRYLQELLRVHLTTQVAVYGEVRQDRAALGQVLDGGGTVNIEGYEVSQAMGDQLNALALVDEAVPRAARALVVQIERTESGQPSREMLALAGRHSGVTLEVVQEEPFWKEIQRYYERAPKLFDRTLGWLDIRE